MATKLPAELLQSLAAAKRTAGWNMRRPDVRRFDIGGCTLFVVPARCWAYRRIERQAAAWHRGDGQCA